MSDGSRRSGCGCLSFVFVLFLVGSVLSVALAWSEGNRLGAIVTTGAGAVILAGLVAAVVARARRQQDEDDLQSASPTAPPPRSISGSGSGRSAREVRSGARHLTTEPTTEEARALKQRLTEAVSDLADNVEEMPARTEGEAGRRLTSDEMIARAKQRIRERGEHPDL